MPQTVTLSITNINVDMYLLTSVEYEYSYCEPTEKGVVVRSVDIAGSFKLSTNSRINICCTVI